MTDRFCHTGKQVMKNNEHFADAADVKAAIRIAALLNRAEDYPAPTDRTPADVMADFLEPEAVKGVGTRHDTVLTASIAISLKRIADAVATTPEKLGFVDHLAAVLDDASHNHWQRMQP